LPWAAAHAACGALTKGGRADIVPVQEIFMARLVAAFGSSHSVMLTCELEDWLTRFRDSDQRMPFYDRAGERCTYADVLARARPDAAELATPHAITRAFEETQRSMDRLQREIAAAKLDVLIVLGDDQYELFHDQHMPAIAVYYGETISNAARQPVAPEDWYKQAQMRRREPEKPATYPAHRRLALHLIEGMVQKEFDISALSALRPDEHEGHAYSFIHYRYLKATQPVVPMIPVFLNTYNPPNAPTPRRCVALGRALRELILSYPEDIRVGLIASGGLSHFVTDEELDRTIIEAMRKKDLATLAAQDPRRLKAGSSEIRNWIAVAAAASDLTLDWISYVPVYRTPALTGIGLGFATWH
jgi:Catalytic LigB subunit of aromatic ring-opening dioxygenase